jgi:hypothetical protein
MAPFASGQVGRRPSPCRPRVREALQWLGSCFGQVRPRATDNAVWCCAFCCGGIANLAFSQEIRRMFESCFRWTNVPRMSVLGSRRLANRFLGCKFFSN